MATETIWENLSRYAFLFLALFLPIFILPYTIFPLELNKAFLFYIVTLIAGIFWLISILQKASFKIPKSIVLLALAGIILVWLISSLFSSNFSISLIGAGQEVGTFFSLTFLAVGLFLVSVLFQSEAKVMIFYLLLFISSLLVFIFQLFRTAFDITFFPWNIFFGKVANTIGSWNEVGIFFGFICLLSLVFLELFHFSKKLKIFFFLVLITSLAAMAFVNFTTVWVVFVTFLFIFLVYLFSVFPVLGQEEGYQSRKFVRFTIFVLLIVLFFIFARALMGDFVTSLGIVSLEVRPSWSATFEVIKSVLRENVLFGSGPNTFLYDWLKFKPAEINYSLFWAFPFGAGIGLLPSFIATTGILGLVAWLFFLVCLLYYIFRVIAYSGNEVTRGLLMASLLGSLYLWTFTIIYTPGFLLVALAFLTTGIFLALLVKTEKIKLTEVSFFQRPKISFVSSLCIVLLMIVGVASFYLLFQKYWAACSFGRGLLVFNKGGNIDEVENLLMRASRYDQEDRYFRALSETGLLRLQQLMNQTDLPPEEARARFQDSFTFALSNAQSATKVNSLDFLNWMSLGQVYESVVPLKISGAKEAAANAYQEALQRAPFDPRPLFTKARTEIQAGDLKSAKESLNSAVNLKGDYAPALFLLAQLEAQEGNLKQAIARTEQTFYLAPNDVGVLFQLGLLYYQDKNFENSRLAFEKAVALNLNYSNARYFLGLIYERMGRISDAIDQFKRIENLNPDNQEVKRILSNLMAGIPALETISPPQPSPEKRKEPPLDETKLGKELKKK